jgi:hypothetical protein
MYIYLREVLKDTASKKRKIELLQRAEVILEN